MDDKPHLKGHVQDHVTHFLLAQSYANTEFF